MSQVKNLRAMFENKGDTSPPDRGRASGASTPNPGGTDSPRPLSKVRTNFVAVEKDGRIGLRRDPSHESSVSRRRLSMETDAESVSTVPDKSVAGADDVATRSRSFLNEPIPESPRQPPETEKAAETKPEKKPEPLGAVTDKPSHNPDKHMDEEDSPAPLSPADPTFKPPAPATTAASTPVAVNGKSKAEKPKNAASAAPAKTTAVKKTTAAPRPSTIATKATPSATTKPPAKSPSVAKTPTSATHKPDHKPGAARLHEKPAAKKEPAATTRAGSSVTKPTASSASKKPQPLKASASETGFVKPKPKSPTKPVQLPASLMAPTASSVSKGNVPRQSLSRQSGSLHNLNIPGRSPSRASAVGATAGKTVKRQSSTINRQRPSLGPPPKKTAQDHPVAKKEAHVDEGFLARMMRPTQSSSSKTTEKAPVTPPRRTAKRPSTGADNYARRESSVKSHGSARKPLRRHVESRASEVAVSAEPSVVSAEEVHERAKEEVDLASHASAAAEKPTRAETPVQETKEPEAVPEPTVEEVAVETANVETAEEAVELAKEADLVEIEPTNETAPVEAKESEPASLAELKEEAAKSKTEDPFVEEPETAAEKVEDKEPAPEATIAETEEPTKPEEAAEQAADDEEKDNQVDELADAVKELSFHEKDEPVSNAKEPVEEVKPEATNAEEESKVDVSKEEDKPEEENPTDEPETASKEEVAAQ